MYETETRLSAYFERPAVEFGVVAVVVVDFVFVVGVFVTAAAVVDVVVGSFLPGAAGASRGGRSYHRQH